MFSRILYLSLLSSTNIIVNCVVNIPQVEVLSKCKVHYSRSENSYTKFYAINEKHRNSSLVFDFHFSVLAPRDAHILLTPSPNVKSSDPVYEIVLGAGGNSFSEIRRLQKKATKSSKQTFNLLSSLLEKSFWIHFSKDGLLEVGKEGSDIAFLVWQDPDPLPIQYFSFCTWGNIEAKWYYDCLREDNTSSDSQEVQKPLSSREKLKIDLFSAYDPYVRPTYSQDDLTIINLWFTPQYITLDEMTAKFGVLGNMEMQWLDEKINWHKEDYDNIEILNLHYREIWQPDLYLYNSASGPTNDFAQTLRLGVTSEGWATWMTRVKMEAWCDVSRLDHWPKDVHVCELQLGFWTLDNLVMIQNSFNESKLTQEFASEWELLSIESGHYLIPSIWNSESDQYSSTFVIRFSLRRRSNIYSTVYFAPIIVVSVSLLLSFWISPTGSYRISLYCFQLVLVSLVLIKLGGNIPGHPVEVPYIVLLYSYSFFGILIALLFTILFINLAYIKHTKPIPYFIYKFLSFNWVKNILFLQNLKSSESYNNLIEDNTPKDSGVQEMWLLLSLTLDRILFVIYCILIVVFVSKQY